MFTIASRGCQRKTKKRPLKPSTLSTKRSINSGRTRWNRLITETIGCAHKEIYSRSEQQDLRMIAGWGSHGALISTLALMYLAHAQRKSRRNRNAASFGDQPQRLNHEARLVFVFRPVPALKIIYQTIYHSRKCEPQSLVLQDLHHRRFVQPHLRS